MMNEVTITIEELIKSKKEAELKIINAINEFEKITGVHVEDIQTHSMLCRSDKGPYQQIGSVNINLLFK